MADIRVSTDWRGIDELMEAFSALQERVKETTPLGVNEGAQELAAKARQNAVVNPKVRTGALDASITASPVEERGEGSWEATVAPRGIIYARAQELGAVIVPKHSRFLKIPIMTLVGYHGGGVGAIHNFPHEKGRGISPEQEYLYVRSVTLPPRPYLRPALEDITPDYAEAMTQRWADAISGS